MPPIRFSVSHMLFASIVLLGFVGSSAAQTSDAQCLAAGHTCTAGDVGIHTLEVVSVADGCTGPGDTATVTFRAAIHNNVGGASYDIGVFVATGGGLVIGGASCYHTYLPPNFTSSPTYGDFDTDGILDVYRLSGAATPPFYEVGNNAENTCGDLEAGREAVIEFGPVTVACVDTTGDGWVDLEIAVSNRPNQTPSTDCLGVGGALPGNGSKCTVARLNFLNLPLPVALQSMSVD